jgi:hypothetical protein
MGFKAQLGTGNEVALFSRKLSRADTSMSAANGVQVRA